MTEDKKKPEEDEVTEGQLKDLSGGIIDINHDKKKIAEPDKKPPDGPGIIDIDI